MELPILRSCRSGLRESTLFLIVLHALAFGFRIDDRIAPTVQLTVDHIINNKYDRAVSLIDSAMTREKDPVLPVLKLAALGMRDVDYEKIVDSTSFFNAFAGATVSIDAWEKLHGISSYSQTLSGMSRIIHLTFYLKQKKYVTSLRKGFDALDQLREAQKMDSSNHDADFFLGLYDYARAELKSRLWWILFWYPGDRRQGIEKVTRCANHGSITDEAAKLSLCDILLQEKRPMDAKKIIDEMKDRYPESRFVLWAEAKYFESRKCFLKAADVYSILASSYAETSSLGEYNYLFTSGRRAHMLLNAERCEEAKKLCDDLLLHENMGSYKEIRKDLEKVSERCRDGTDH